MTTYGTSAYLKLICLSQRASVTEIRKRLAPSEGGYDFHKRLRSIAGQFLTGRITLDDALSDASNITKSSERESARTALLELSNWRRNNPGAIMEGSPIIFSHESGLFSVKFHPDFLIDNGTNRIAFHIWNTLRPPLIERETLGALTLFADRVSQIRHEPDDIAILYLRRQIVHRLSQASEEHVRIGYQSAQQVATTMHSVEEGLRDRGTVGRDRPSSPPSPRP